MLKEDGEFAELFNSFYTSLAESYVKAMEREVADMTFDKAMKVTVGWEEIPKETVKLKKREKKHPGTFICISRTIRVLGEIKQKESDIFYKSKNWGVILR